MHQAAPARIRAGLAGYSRAMIDYDSAVPPYRQVASLIEARIRSGELAPGARVPSIVTLSQQYGVAKNTARRALRELADRELIEVIQGWGSFVKHN
jgi:GntR family transcriptional regulator